MWDAVLVVIFCYALVHKVDDGAKVPWTIVFIPVLLILLEYVLQLLYWMLRDVAGPVILSPLQRKCTDRSACALPTSFAVYMHPWTGSRAHTRHILAGLAPWRCCLRQLSRLILPVPAGAVQQPGGDSEKIRRGVQHTAAAAACMPWRVASVSDDPHSESQVMLCACNCWAELDRATRTTCDPPEVHQQCHHLKYRKYPGGQGLQAKGTFRSKDHSNSLATVPGPL